MTSIAYLLLEFVFNNQGASKSRGPRQEHPGGATLRSTTPVGKRFLSRLGKITNGRSGHSGQSSLPHTSFSLDSGYLKHGVCWAMLPCHECVCTGTGTTNSRCTREYALRHFSRENSAVVGKRIANLYPDVPGITWGIRTGLAGVTGKTSMMMVIP